MLLVDLSNLTARRRELVTTWCLALVSGFVSRAYGRARANAPFFLYLDEFQNFVSLSLVNALSELRKFRLGLVLAHQYLSQLAEAVRSSVLGNVGSMTLFRVGAEDAQVTSI